MQVLKIEVAVVYLQGNKSYDAIYGINLLHFFEGFPKSKIKIHKRDGKWLMIMVKWSEKINVEQWPFSNKKKLGQGMFDLNFPTI